MKLPSLKKTLPAVLLSFLAASTPASAENVVIFAGYGGSMQQAQRSIYFDPFEKETGIRVIDVADVQLAKIKAMVENRNVEWDVVQALDMWIPQGAQAGLWEPIDYQVVRQPGIPESLRTPYAVGTLTSAVILAYNSKSFEGRRAPASWADFWNTKDFPGPRGLPDSPRYALEAALLADGVKPETLYPLDVDRAFKSLDRIKNDIHVWLKQAPQAPVLLNSGELSAALSFNNRIIPAKKNDHAPLEISWEQGLHKADFLAIPKGSKRAVNAQKLIQFMSDPQRQAALAQATGLGPANLDALPLLKESDRLLLPGAHFGKPDSALIQFDASWWSANDASVQQRWNRWKLQ